MRRYAITFHRRATSLAWSLLAMGLLIGLLTACSSPVSAPTADATKTVVDGLLKIYTPPEQFAPEVLAAFERKHNALVTLAIYRNEAELNTEVESGPIDYDLALVSGYMIPSFTLPMLLQLK